MRDARYSTTTQRRLICVAKDKILKHVWRCLIFKEKRPCCNRYWNNDHYWNNHFNRNNHFNSGNYFNSGRYFDSSCNRPTDLNGHMSIRNVTLHSCQKGSYLHINKPIIEWINFNRGELHSNLLVKMQFMPCILLNIHQQYGLLPLWNLQFL